MRRGPGFAYSPAQTTNQRISPQPQQLRLNGRRVQTRRVFPTLGRYQGDLMFLRNSSLAVKIGCAHPLARPTGFDAEKIGLARPCRARRRKRKPASGAELGVALCPRPPGRLVRATPQRGGAPQLRDRIWNRGASHTLFRVSVGPQRARIGWLRAETAFCVKSNHMLKPGTDAGQDDGWVRVKKPPRIANWLDEVDCQGRWHSGQCGHTSAKRLLYGYKGLSRKTPGEERAWLLSLLCG